MALTPDALVSALASRCGWPSASVEGGLQLTLTLANGRRQHVRIESFDHMGERFVRFSTVAGARAQLTPERCERALVVNRQLPHGHLALDESHLVLTETRPLEGLTAESCAPVVEFIAKQADLYERVIFKSDKF